MQPLVVDKNTLYLSGDINDYPGGIVIPIDKPYRWTSADVIRKVKYAAIRHFGKKNLKVGHAGTLDPLATGVLLVCIGNATKLAEEFQRHDKEYVAGVTFGATTPSYDLEKDIDRFFPYEHISEDAVRGVLPGFLGEQDQVAPLFSAKSVDGVRAYELARKIYAKQGSPVDSAAQGCGCCNNPSHDFVAGPSPCGQGGSTVTATTSLSSSDNKSNDVVAEPSLGNSELDEAAKDLLRVSRINITEIELISFEGPKTPCAEGASVPVDVDEPVSKASSRINVVDTSVHGLPRADIRLACSKGTYVRAFARDLGEALGSGAHLDALQRSRSGFFSVVNALSVDQAISLLNEPDKN